MKIGQYNGTGLIKAYETQLKNNRELKNDKPEAGKTLPGDALELSSGARELQRYRSELARLPEVGEERVAALKRQIQEQNYRPDPEKIAAGMVRERLLDERV